MAHSDMARQGAAPLSIDAQAPRWGRVGVLAAGDIIAFLLFATQGRSAHGESLTPDKIVLTAAPFIIAWFVAAPWLGAFGRRGSAATTRPLPLLQRTALSWVVAWAVALLLRYVVFRGGIAPAFAIVALLVNAVLLLGWRGIAAALFWRR